MKVYRRLEVPGQARGRLTGKSVSGIPEVNASLFGGEVTGVPAEKSVGSELGGCPY